MPIYVSGSAGTTTISGSGTQTSGSTGYTTYGKAGAKTFKRAKRAFAQGLPIFSATGSYPTSSAGTASVGAFQVVSGSDCYSLYINLPLSGSTVWALVTSSC